MRSKPQLCNLPSWLGFSWLGILRWRQSAKKWKRANFLMNGIVEWRRLEDCCQCLMCLFLSSDPPNVSFRKKKRLVWLQTKFPNWYKMNLITLGMSVRASTLWRFVPRAGRLNRSLKLKGDEARIWDHNHRTHFKRSITALFIVQCPPNCTSDCTMERKCNYSQGTSEKSLSMCGGQSEKEFQIDSNGL